MGAEINTKSMAEGNLAKLILAFAVPLMLGNIFQQLYTFVDTVVVGKALGVNALAALGATEWMIFFVMGGIQGLTHGFSIVIAQLFGKQDFAGLKKAVICTALLSVFLTKVVGEYGVFWGEIFAWAGAGLLLLFGFFWLMYSRKSVTNRLIFRAASAFAPRLRISSRITFVSIITFQFSRLPLCLHLV